MLCLLPAAPLWAVQSLTLGWDASTDTNVTGYALYYGTVSSNYTTRVDLGTNQEAEVTDLAENTTYYFAVVSYNAAALESPLSPEISSTISGNMQFSMGGAAGTPPTITWMMLAGHAYQLQASSDLTNWTVLLQTTAATSNSLVQYQDLEPGVTYPQRFYRYIQQ